MLCIGHSPPVEHFTRSQPKRATRPSLETSTGIIVPLFREKGHYLWQFFFCDSSCRIYTRNSVAKEVPRTQQCWVRTRPHAFFVGVCEEGWHLFLKDLVRCGETRGSGSTRIMARKVAGYGTVGTGRYRTVKYSTVPYSEAQYGTVHGSFIVTYLFHGLRIANNKKRGPWFQAVCV